MKPTDVSNLSREQFRQAVRDAVVERLGLAALARFAMEFESIPGRDYTAERQRRQDEAAASAASEVAEHGEEYKVP